VLARKTSALQAVGIHRRSPKSKASFGLKMVSFLFHQLRKRLGAMTPRLVAENADRAPASHGGLSDKLFTEYDRRVAEIKSTSIDSTANDIKQRGVFENATAIVFAAASHNTMNLQIWLETIFDLDVIMVYEPSQFYEWLFRSAEQADLVFVERDAFHGEAPAFGTFIRAASEAYPHSPILVLSQDFETAPCKVTHGDQMFDISLKSPLSQTSIWLAMKAAGDIALNGKQLKPNPVLLSEQVA